MTREKALEVNRALNNIEGFEALMDKIAEAVADAMDTCELVGFSCRLAQFMEEEYDRRKRVLEEL